MVRTLLESGSGALTEGRGRKSVQAASLMLSSAERLVLKAALTGSSNKEIASALKKSEKTVKAQLTSIYRKFGVPSRARLLALLGC